MNKLKLRLIVVSVVVAVLVVGACKPDRREPICHIVPDPEFGNLTCRYY